MAVAVRFLSEVSCVESLFKSNNQFILKNQQACFFFSWGRTSTPRPRRTRSRTRRPPSHSSFSPLIHTLDILYPSAQAHNSTMSSSPASQPKSSRPSRPLAPLAGNKCDGALHQTRGRTAAAKQAATCKRSMPVSTADKGNGPKRGKSSTSSRDSPVVSPYYL